MRILILIPRPSYYQKCLSPCMAQSGLLHAFRHDLSPLGLVPCGFYKHEFNPMTKHGVWTKDSLVPLTEQMGSASITTPRWGKWN